MQKLSFGFKKVIKAQPKQDETKQFIECLEGKSIKVIGEVLEDKKPLVIPLKPNDKTVTAAALLRIAQEVENGILIDETQNVAKKDDYQPLPIPENESLEAKAARELLEEARKVERANKEADSNLVVPIAKPPTLTGEKESTMDDYENIPIAEFGMAMLRGMGWTPGKGAVSLQIPNLRPKGMGLGADKTIKQLNGANGENKTTQEELKIIKGAFVKFTSGKHTGTYGQVTGFDEDSGRVIIKTAISGENLTVNEFMVMVVNKSEYQKYSKVLNTAKYDEYKKRDETRHEKVKPEYISQREPSKEYRHSNIDSKSSSQKYSNEKDDRRHSCTTQKDERRFKKHSESDSDSNHDRKRNDRSRNDDRSHQDKRRDRKYSSSSSDSDEKPSRDKKRKGKKKRRDRSRSRNNRRH